MKKRRSKIDSQQIIKMFQEVHGNRYDYSLVDYKTMHHKVSVSCDIHGKFKQLPNTHFRRGHGCPVCGINKNTKRQIDTTESFIGKAKKIHGNRYDYSKVVYGKSAHKKVEIVCRSHGSFFMTPNIHLSKKANCPKCSKNWGGWTKESWKKSCEGKVAKFYIVKCSNEEEVFYKIGMTNKRTIEERFSCKHVMPYKYEVIKIVESEKDPVSIWQLERSVLKLHKKFQYKPLIWFDGHTECFSKILL